jgi:hypothetical protein
MENFRCLLCLLCLFVVKRLTQGSDGEAVEAASHAVDVCERKLARVGAVAEQDEYALLPGIDPKAGAGESVVTKTIAREIGPGR